MLKYLRYPMFFMAEDGTPTGTPAAPSAPEEGASVFSGFTINKDGLNATVTGDELKEKPPVSQEPPAASTPPAPKAGAVPLEARVKGPSHKHFEEVTSARDKALKDLEEYRKSTEAKIADYETRLAKGQVPEEFKSQLAEALAAKAKLEKDMQGIIATRAAQLEFEPRKTAALEKIALIATTAGDQAMVAAAKNGNYDALAEFAENGDNLTPLQKRDLNRLLDEARGYDEQLSQRTKDPEAAWQELQQRNQVQMQEAQKAQLAKNLELANTTHGNLSKAVPALADAPELSKEIKARLTALAGGDGNEKYTASHMMQVVAEHAVFETLCKSQQAKIQKLEADLKEKTESVNRLKAPSFRPSHVEPELEEATIGTGLFSGGIVVNTNGSAR